MGDTQDSKKTFMAYQVFGSDGVKLPIGFKVEAGAEVVVYGPIVNYKGNTPETQGKGAAHIVTINGKKDTVILRNIQFENGQELYKEEEIFRDVENGRLSAVIYPFVKE